MKSKETKLPLNLQFFAEGDPASEPEKNDLTPTPEPEKKEEEINLATELAQLKAQLAKQKNDFDKVMSENGTLRKKLKEKQTAEEAELEAKAEAEAAREEYVKGLEEFKAVTKATERYMKLGMDSELAKDTATAEVKGDRDKVDDNINRFHTEWQKAEEAKLKEKYLGEMAKFQSGNNGTVDYQQQYNNALTNGDKHGAILAQLQGGLPSGVTT